MHYICFLPSSRGSKLFNLVAVVIAAAGWRRKRHELARDIATEDGEPWRIAEKAAEIERNSGAGEAAGEAATDINRLRATVEGTARLARALAQGEVPTTNSVAF